MHADLLVPFGEGDGDAPPLYCVHSASGSAYTYLPLARLLAGRRVVGIEAPGYDSDGLPPTDLRELADRYARAVVDDCGGRQACLLGWSMGGSVAYAMAGRLRALGVAVPLVVIVDALMHHTEPVPPVREILTRFAINLVTEAGGGQAEERVIAALRAWPPGAPVTDAWELLYRVDLIPEDLDVETLGRRFEVFRRNVAALHRYAPEPGYPGPLLVIDGEDSARGPLRWADVAPDVRTATVPGDHFSLWRGAGLAVLGAKVTDALREACPSPAQEVRA
ncbi:MULTISPECIES: alpha/beta fold hydrolase [Micromonospora]|uniref:thioesterase domain-containing protein n=1 Tax=Micromonospora TaxID=1873 RepID=UPI00131A0B9C|nr:MULTISPECIES: alpha/beta fold hydrolase [Micromonospora]NES16833.1 alpha/beta fold hydrolase [Micromonospora sp. PPF5-17B]NES38526.1 alpha/beta fold hydrolase [Micromonospora solifontis]NES58472.1 alpha/beta fold hydrolase [Micromonospora sp. PPF5-6]